MRSPPSTGPLARRPAVGLAVVALALGVGALAWLSPADATDSDPALTLLTAQAWLDHGSPDLAPYAGRPELAYDLETHRLVRADGERRIYRASQGAALLSVPAVALANLLGRHALDLPVERGLQNLLSALCCAALVPLLYALARCYLGPAASALIAAVTVLGSPLVSTGATALWSSDYAAVLLAAALLHLARVETGVAARHSYLLLAALLGGAFLSRPTAAFAVVAVLYHLAGRRPRASWERPLALAALVAIVALVVAWKLRWLRLPTYYRPGKLRWPDELVTPLHGLLLSPGRGLLVFCPFLAVVFAGLGWRGRAVLADRLPRAVLLWIGVHGFALLGKNVWWGGHCFGPRLWMETFPGFALLAAAAGRALRTDPSGRAEPGAAAARVARPAASPYLLAYALTGALAVSVHAGVGLFDPHADTWNRSPDVDEAPEALFLWSSPQFLATAASVRERHVAWQRRSAGPVALGERLRYDDPDLVLAGWYGAEDGHRWSRGERSSILLRFAADARSAAADPGRGHLLELWGRTLDGQPVEVAADGRPLGALDLPGPGAGRLSSLPALAWLPPGAVEPGRELELAFTVRDARAPSDPPRGLPDAPPPPPARRDERVLGVALRGLRVRPWPDALAGIGPGDAVFFREGFGEAIGAAIVGDPGEDVREGLGDGLGEGTDERTGRLAGTLRRTKARRARVLIPRPAPAGPAPAGPSAPRRLEIELSAPGPRRVLARLDGGAAERWTVDGAVPVRRSIALGSSRAVLAPFHVLDLEVSAPPPTTGEVASPSARAPAAGPPSIAVHGLRLLAGPVDPGRAPTGGRGPGGGA